MIVIRNISVALDDERALEEIVAKRIKIKPEDIAGLQVLRRGIDARRYRGAPIHFVYMVQLRLQGKESEQTVLRRCRRDNNVSAARVEPEKAPAIMREHRPDDLRPIVVGFGPAGMLAALQLAKAGWQPLVLERGLDVDARQAAVEHFWQTGELGKVDMGGGGTVAAYIANLDVDTIDMGVPVLAMHAPYEAISKLDLYMAYKAFAVFMAD